MSYGKREAMKSGEWSRWLVRENFVIPEFDVTPVMVGDVGLVIRRLRRKPVAVDDVKPETKAMKLPCNLVMNACHCSLEGVWSDNFKVA